MVKTFFDKGMTAKKTCMHASFLLCVVFACPFVQETQFTLFRTVTDDTGSAFFLFDAANIFSNTYTYLFFDYRKFCTVFNLE